MSRTIFYGPKDVRAIEVRLYFHREMEKIIPELSGKCKIISTEINNEKKCSLVQLLALFTKAG